MRKITKILGLGVAVAMPLMSPLTTLAQPAFKTGLDALPPEEYAQEPAAPRARSAVLLSKADLTPYFPNPGDQGMMGSCSGWAVSYGARSYYLAGETKKKPTTTDEISSPGFVFNQSSSRPNIKGDQCGGATFRGALNVLVNVGSTSWTYWPYTDTTCMPNVPSNDALAVSSRWKIPGYDAFTTENIKTLDSYRERLERGHPVIVGLTINTDEWFRMPKGNYTYTLGATSLMAGGKHGYHAMVVIAYDDDRVAANGDKGAFKLINSWSRDWGDGGYVWISYEAFKAMVKEAYVMTGMATPLNPRNDAGPAPQPQPTPTPTPTPQPNPAPVDIYPQLTQIVGGFRTGELRLEKLGNGYRITGHGCVDEVRRLRKQLSPYLGRLMINVEETPWPACEIRGLMKTAIARGGVQVSVTNLEAGAVTAERGVEVSLAEQNVESTPILKKGDRFKIDVTTTAAAPYVQVFYLQADQSAKEIYRGKVSPNAAGLYHMSIGSDGSPLRLKASPPYGIEAVLVLASTQPVSEKIIAMNASEVSFMDRLRGDLSNDTNANADIRAAITQVEVQDTVAPGTSWLVTAAEVQSFNASGVEDLSNDAPGTGLMNAIGDPKGPKITVLSPKLDGAINGKMAIKATFAAPADAKVRPETVRVRYKTPVGWFDVTDRVRKEAQVSAAGITAAPMDIPNGKHLIRVSVFDDKGREAIVEIAVTAGQ
ncbi:C1 family peptidase [Asticcacaulis sp. YBE204]|uniref:C1 family peptidase n=1 Tax=Asticcacaulis sp. YBE204 TaxID=1282363 RepID=UPI0003C3EF40|nr:C1 family peptidase [Asticcacaulis sp. YBE204]ESQ77878.1 hypothetical protein AEYBE204_16500 [Asticcacaulis sp. YBE204]